MTAPMRPLLVLPLTARVRPSRDWPGLPELLDDVVDVRCGNDPLDRRDLVPGSNEEPGRELPHFFIRCRRDSELGHAGFLRALTDQFHGGLVAEAARQAPDFLVDLPEQDLVQGQ